MWAKQKWKNTDSALLYQQAWPVGSGLAWFDLNCHSKVLRWLKHSVDILCVTLLCFMSQEILFLLLVTPRALAWEQEIFLRMGACWGINVRICILCNNQFYLVLMTSAPFWYGDLTNVGSLLVFISALPWLCTGCISQSRPDWPTMSSDLREGKCELLPVAQRRRRRKFVA